MIRVLGLDLSVKSTGWALWSESLARPACGIWKLAPSIDWRARAFVRLQRNIMDLHRVGALTHIAFEEPISPGALHGHTNLDTIHGAIGLASHVQSFCEAGGVRCYPVGLSTWRRHFLGKMPRGTKTADLKAMAMQRCRELGFDPEKHDAAEACGILDYQLHRLQITPPWAHTTPLRLEMMPGVR